MKLITLIALISCVNCQKVCDKGKLVFVGNNLNDKIVTQKGYSWSSLGSPYWSNSKKTFIYLSGWRQTYNTQDAKEMLTALLNLKSTYNIIYLDWAAYTDNFVFITTLMDMNCISNYFKDMLFEMKNAGLNTNDIHMIGFNLGAHLAGTIGRNVFSSIPFTPSIRIKRISGLDPSGAFGYNILYSFFGVGVIGAGDADFVDIIHTSAGKFGHLDVVGDVDFWPNQGQTQNGCTYRDSIRSFLANQTIDNIYVLACSHYRAISYFIESLSSPTAFSSFCCTPGITSRPPQSNTCQGNSCLFSNINYMGFYATKPSAGSGPYYLLSTTDNIAKFSLS